MKRSYFFTYDTYKSNCIFSINFYFATKIMNVSYLQSRWLSEKISIIICCVLQCYMLIWTKHSIHQKLLYTVIVMPSPIQKKCIFERLNKNMLSRCSSMAMTGQRKFMLGYLKPIEEKFVCHIIASITKNLFVCV